jgi:hypothetical protein
MISYAEACAIMTEFEEALDENERLIARRRVYADELPRCSDQASRDRLGAALRIGEIGTETKAAHQRLQESSERLGRIIGPEKVERRNDVDRQVAPLLARQTRLGEDNEKASAAIERSQLALRMRRERL